MWQKLIRDNLWKTFSDFFLIFKFICEIIYYFDLLFSFLYSSFSVKLNYDRICSWINHLISLQIFSELLIKLLIFIWFVHESAIWCLISAKWEQYAITCAAVSFVQLHWQTKNSTSDIYILFKNAVKSILFVFIWMIIVLFIL